MKGWLVAAGLVALAAVLLYLAWQSRAGARLGAAYDALVGEAAQERADLDAKDAAIRGLSARIKELSDQAGAARRRADEAEAGAVARGQEVARLEALVAALRAEAAARPVIDDRRKALEALKRLGYPVD